MTSTMMKLKLNVLEDPVHRQPDHGASHGALSPMDPPQAYQPPGVETIPEGGLHPFLGRLGGEHARLGEALDRVESVLQKVKTDGFNEESDREVMRFLETFDRDFVPHSREEEAVLFPLLHDRLIADGEHSKGGETVTTPVDIMRKEHQDAAQLAAVALNFIRLGLTLRDEASALTVVKAGLHAMDNLVELLRLHMFREDNIVFASAQRLLSKAELDGMGARRA